MRDYGVYVNGRLAWELPSPPNDTIGSRWEMGREGTYQFLAVAGNVIRRYRVTAPDDTSVATLVSEVEAGKSQLDCCGDRGQERGGGGHRAAKARADPDPAEAVAERQADAEANTQARLEALEARKKAAAEAAAAKAAKR